MLAGVVELVLRLTIAEEKIELSVLISSAVCVCMCVTTCTVFVARFLSVLMCVNAHIFVFARVVQSAAEKDTAVAQ